MRPLLTLLPLAVGCSDLRQVTINEFMAENATVYEDNGTHPDWIELYNAGSDRVDLSGWYLTDDRMDPLKWRIPDGVEIEGKGFLLFQADEDPEQGDTHAEFKLSGDGEDVGLYGPDERDNPEIDLMVAYGTATEDVSISRVGDGGERWNYQDTTPSPGRSNGK